jgi:hypothetical protein
MGPPLPPPSPRSPTPPRARRRPARNSPATAKSPSDASLASALLSEGTVGFPNELPRRCDPTRRELPGDLATSTAFTEFFTIRAYDLLETVQGSR